MTLQSSSGICEEVAISGPSSTSTSSTDVYPLPLSLGRKEIHLDDEEKIVVTDVGHSKVASPGASVTINDSPYARVGDHTAFNGDVTIIQYISSNELPSIQNGAVIEEVECNGTGRVRSQKTNQRQNIHQNILKKYTYLITLFVFILLVLLILTCIFIFKDSIFDRAPTFPSINSNTSNFIQGYPVYFKTNWGALPVKLNPPLLPSPTSLIIISHSATQSCKNFTECANQTQQIQYSFLKAGYKDIGYNFLIGGEGGIYIGRGWDRQNSLRVGSITVSFIGDFNKELLEVPAQEAAKALIEEGVKIGMVDENYKLIGENQTSAKRYYSPGRNVVTVIKQWEHYFPGTML